MAARQAPRKYVLVLNAGNVADALVRRIEAGEDLHGKALLDAARKGVNALGDEMSKVLGNPSFPFGAACEGNRFLFGPARFMITLGSACIGDDGWAEPLGFAPDVLAPPSGPESNLITGIKWNAADLWWRRGPDYAGTGEEAARKIAAWIEAGMPA